jgi:hypothetical protein
LEVRKQDFYPRGNSRCRLSIEVPVNFLSRGNPHRGVHLGDRAVSGVARPSQSTLSSPECTKSRRFRYGKGNRRCSTERVRGTGRSGGAIDTLVIPVIAEHVLRAQSLRSRARVVRFISNGRAGLPMAISWMTDCSAHNDVGLSIDYYLSLRKK